MDRTIRYFEDREIRAAVSEGNRSIICGHPAVFNCETRIGDYFREVIDSRAFDNADMSDVFLFVNHKVDVPLARARINSPESTMTLTIDDRGLAMTATLNTAENEEAKRLYSAIKRGDISGMSFAFQVSVNEWRDLESDCPLRVIKAISKVYEVSVVTFPAYEATDVMARDKDKSLLERVRAEYPNNKEMEIQKKRIQIIGGLKL